MQNRRNAVKSTARSLFLISAWSAPIISSVLLPAHATMSDCVTQGITGIWQFDMVYDNGTVYEFSFDFDSDPFQFDDSTSIFEEGTLYSLFLGTSVIVDISLGVSNFNNQCSAMSGTFNNLVHLAGPDSEVISGTWTAVQTN